MEKPEVLLKNTLLHNKENLSKISKTHANYRPPGIGFKVMRPMRDEMAGEEVKSREYLEASYWSSDIKYAPIINKRDEYFEKNPNSGLVDFMKTLSKEEKALYLKYTDTIKEIAERRRKEDGAHEDPRYIYRPRYFDDLGDNDVLDKMQDERNRRDPEWVAKNPDKKPFEYHFENPMYSHKEKHNIFNHRPENDEDYDSDDDNEDYINDASLMGLKKVTRHDIQNRKPQSNYNSEFTGHGRRTKRRRIKHKTRSHRKRKIHNRKRKTFRKK